MTTSRSILATLAASLVLSAWIGCAGSDKVDAALTHTDSSTKQDAATHKDAGFGQADKGADASSGAVKYTNVDPDVVVSTWNAYQLKFFDATGESGRFYLWFHPVPEVVLNAFDADCHVLANASGLPAAIDLNHSIGPASTQWVKAQGYIVLNRKGTGNWVGATGKFLGLKFKKDGAWHYGWVGLDIDAAPTKFVVKDYAYQTTAELALRAGEGRP